MVEEDEEELPSSISCTMTVFFKRAPAPLTDSILSIGSTRSMFFFISPVIATLPSRALSFARLLIHPPPLGSVSRPRLREWIRAYIFPRQRHFLAEHGADKSSAPRFIGSVPLCRARPPRIPPDKPRGYRPLDPMTFGRILLPSRANGRTVRSISAASRGIPRDFYPSRKSRALHDETGRIDLFRVCRRARVCVLAAATRVEQR